MENQVATQARLLAARAGAQFALMPSAAYDTSDPRLAILAEALLPRIAAVGANLSSLRWENNVLVAQVNDDQAEEPVCPGAFARMVRQLSYTLLGEVVEGRLAAPAPAYGPGRSPLHRVA